MTDRFHARIYLLGLTLIALLAWWLFMHVWVFHPLGQCAGRNCRGYQSWSGIFGSFLVGGGIWSHLFLQYRKHKCDTPRCIRMGRHPTADGLHHLCHVCHPDLPDHRLTLPEIHLRHHEARAHQLTAHAAIVAAVAAAQPTATERGPGAV